MMFIRQGFRLYFSWNVIYDKVFMKNMFWFIGIEHSHPTFAR